MKTKNYKGKGEHSVRKLELIIEKQVEELHLIKSGQKKLQLGSIKESSLIRRAKGHIASKVGYEIRTNGGEKYRFYGANDDWMIEEVVRYVLSNFQ